METFELDYLKLFDLCKSYNILKSDQYINEYSEYKENKQKFIIKMFNIVNSDDLYGYNFYLLNTTLDNYDFLNGYNDNVKMFIKKLYKHDFITYNELFNTIDNLKDVHDIIFIIHFHIKENLKHNVWSPGDISNCDY